VNIAARVGECAKAGEVLVSDPARAAMDGRDFEFGRSRRLRDSGAPRDLSVQPVTAARG
jgi:class 3 adenylate cyclase